MAGNPAGDGSGFLTSTNDDPLKFMKNTFWLAGRFGFIVLGLAVVTSVQAGSYLASPTGDFLVLSNAAGTVRVLDSKGLVLEKNLAFLPRIPLADLSPAELQALLETKTAYAGLTTFAPGHATNAQGAVIEHQLQKIWRQEPSLARKIQTRLEILEDLRDYNNELALLPGSLAAANQYAINAIPIQDQLTNRAATVVAAAAQVEATERDRAGGPAAQVAEQQAQENYRELSVRVEKANDHAMIANGQIAGANQQVADHQARCAALAARLASHGINVSGVPPFAPIPQLTLQTEVDAERKGN
jgi:hypothetical protein